MTFPCHREFPAGNMDRSPPRQYCVPGNPPSFYTLARLSAFCNNTETKQKHFEGYVMNTCKTSTTSIGLGWRMRDRVQSYMAPARGATTMTRLRRLAKAFHGRPPIYRGYLSPRQDSRDYSPLVVLAFHRTPNRPPPLLCPSTASGAPATMSIRSSPYRIMSS